MSLIYWFFVVTTVVYFEWGGEITFKDLYSLVPGNLRGKQINPLMNSANSLYRKSKSSPGPTLIRTLIKTGNVIWYICTQKKFKRKKYKLIRRLHKKNKLIKGTKNKEVQERNLFDLILNIDWLVGRPRSEALFNSVFNVSGNSSF